MTVDLVIAGRRIRLCSREGVSLLPDERFRAFTVPVNPLNDLIMSSLPGISADADPGLIDAGLPLSPLEPDPDLCVEVDPGPGEIPASAAKVFDARLMEEVPGGVINTGEPFWEICSGEDVTYARVFLKEPERIAMLVMPRGAKRWQIFAGGDAKPSASPERDRYRKGREQDDDSTVTVNPLPYPLDGLLLYFLFSLGGDIMIHGSGMVSDGRGWLFTGRSGSGKTTMARIFDGAGDRVIHDDRLVLRRETTGWVMHNTPVYRNDEPRSALLEHLWIIRHGTANVSEPVAGAEAVAMILANSIQQNWNREAAARLAAAADDLAASVKVSRLSFVPDGTIRDYLLLRSTTDKSLAAGAVLSMLDEGRSVTVTAGGYSMWPAIRPGDAVVIDPIGTRIPEIGEIVALKRDGGYVIHRVTGVTAGKDATNIRTQGDGVTREDEPADAGMIAGVVRSVVRSGRQHQAPPLHLPRWINRLAAAVAGWMRG
ncbi:MAG: hypothetical protein RBT50_07165 [Bacteroidales bacterium]|nr:hypothetical protein [Bacteroidales bacterium]